MSSALEHYNSYTGKSNFDWQGLRSSKFSKTKYHIPRNDLIKKGFDVPTQASVRGRKHFSEQNSPEKQFRSIVRITPKIEHWHPRETKKKVFDMSFTLPHPRRQRGHRMPEFPCTERSAGIRTFYNTRVRKDNLRQYSLEDQMQRKRKIDQGQMRRTFMNSTLEPNKPFF